MAVTSTSVRFAVRDVGAEGGEAAEQEGMRGQVGTHGVVGHLDVDQGRSGRDGRRLFISNRGEGSVSVLDMTTNRLIAKWRLPGGGSPDMGGTSPDGTGVRVPLDVADPDSCAARSRLHR